MNKKLNDEMNDDYEAIVVSHERAVKRLGYKMEVEGKVADYVDGGVSSYSSVVKVGRKVMWFTTFMRKTNRRRFSHKLEGTV